MNLHLTVVLSCGPEDSYEDLVAHVDSAAEGDIGAEIVSRTDDGENQTVTVELTKSDIDLGA